MKWPAPEAPTCAQPFSGASASKIGSQPLHRRLVAPGHQAEPHLEAPDPAGDADVDERDLALARLGVPPLRVAEVRVAAVDDRVAGLDDVEQLLERVLGDLPGRHHQPDVARRVQLLRERAQRLRGRVDVRVVRLQLVPVLLQASRHPRAHPAEAHHPELHLEVLQSDANDTTAALLERGEVARRLRADQAGEAEVAARDRQLGARCRPRPGRRGRCSGRPCAAARSSAGSAGRGLA